MRLSERLLSAWAYLGVIIPYWIVLDVALEVWLGHLDFNSLFVPHGAPDLWIPRALLPLLGIIISGLIGLLSWRWSRATAVHALAALALGLLFAGLEAIRPPIIHAVAHAFAPDGVLVCADGPGCTVVTALNFTFWGLAFLCRAAGVAGGVLALIGRPLRTRDLRM